MSMYPTTQAALINAFNSTLFDSYKSAGWQRLASDLCGAYPELDRPAQIDRNFDSGRLSRGDWAGQAGMVSGRLRNTLSNLEFALLKIRYTFDGELLTQPAEMTVRIRITENLYSALVEGWPEVHTALRRHPETPSTLSENHIKLEYLGLRALRPDVFNKAFQASGAESQKTVTNHQYIIKKAITAMVRSAFDKAEWVLEADGLTARAG